MKKLKNLMNFFFFYHVNLLHSVRSSDDGHDKSLDFLFFTPLKKQTNNTGSSEIDRLL